jgi:hypothetical protein
MFQVQNDFYPVFNQTFWTPPVTHQQPHHHSQHQQQQQQQKHSILLNGVVNNNKNNTTNTSGLLNSSSNNLIQQATGSPNYYLNNPSSHNVNNSFVPFNASGSQYGTSHVNTQYLRVSNSNLSTSNKNPITVQTLGRNVGNNLTAAHNPHLPRHSSFHKNDSTTADYRGICGYESNDTAFAKNNSINNAMISKRHYPFQNASFEHAMHHASANPARSTSAAAANQTATMFSHSNSTAPNYNKTNLSKISNQTYAPSSNHQTNTTNFIRVANVNKTGHTVELMAKARDAATAAANFQKIVNAKANVSYNLSSKAKKMMTAMNNKLQSDKAKTSVNISTSSPTNVSSIANQKSDETTTVSIHTTTTTASATQKKRGVGVVGSPTVAVLNHSQDETSDTTSHGSSSGENGLDNGVDGKKGLDSDCDDDDDDEDDSDAYYLNNKNVLDEEAIKRIQRNQNCLAILTEGDIIEYVAEESDLDDRDNNRMWAVYMGNSMIVRYSAETRSIINEPYWRIATKYLIYINKDLDKRLFTLPVYEVVNRARRAHTNSEYYSRFFCSDRNFVTWCRFDINKSDIEFAIKIDSFTEAKEYLMRKFLSSIEIEENKILNMKETNIF